MRKEKSFKNFLTSIIPFFILTFLGFLRLKVLLNSLGEDIYALNQLFIQLFSYLTLLEAGVGTLITQMYYKHFVDGNKKSINEIYSASDKILKKISILMIIIGVVMSFFLGILTNNDLSLGYMQIVFILYLFRCVTEYYMFAPRFVLMADQKVYKINIILNLFKIVEMILEIVILNFYQNYVVILLVSIVVYWLSYYIVNRKIYKEYSWLKKCETNFKISFDKMKDVIAHKLAGTVYSNTDILLASAFLKPIYVVIYSSYNYIVKFINDGIFMLSSAMLASVGNVMYKEEENNQYKIFLKTKSIFDFCGMFFVVALYISINKFIQLWLGADKLIGNVELIFMLLVLYISIINRPFLMIRDSKALYKETKVIAMLEALFNLVLSIVLVQYYGVAGLLFATLFASVVTTAIFYPKYVYHNIFKKSTKNHFISAIVNLSFITIICYILSNFNLINNANNYYIWFLYCIIYGLGILIVIFIYNYLLYNSFRTIVKEIISSFKTRFKH